MADPEALKKIVAEGWVFLEQGKPNNALENANDVLSVDPESEAAKALQKQARLHMKGFAFTIDSMARMAAWDRKQGQSNQPPETNK